LRGTLAYTRDPSIFDLEVAAVARVRKNGQHNLHLILPFVRSLTEWTQARSHLQQQGLQPSSAFQLWLMAEVPSVLFLLEDYVRAGVTGIAIGLHDFTQLMLGIDRDDAEVAEAFDPLHPAVLQAIADLAKTARRLQIPCVVCADSLTGQDFIEPLVRCGVTGICLNAQTVPLAAEAIARAEHRLLLEWGWQQRDRLNP
jgi:pyruvate,water dikinase